MNSSGTEATADYGDSSVEPTVAERTSELTSQIAKREKAEPVCYESQALYHSVVDTLPVGVFRKDSEGRYILVNSWFCQLKNLKAEQLLGKTPQELPGELRNQGPENSGSALEIKLAIEGTKHHELIMQNGKQIELEEQYTGPDGEPQYVHVMKSPVFGPDGRIVGSQGVLMDITARRRVEEELNRERNMLRTVITNSPDAIYIKDITGRKLMANPAELRNMGFKTEAEAVGKSDFDIYPQTLAAAYFADEQAVIQTGQPLINREEKVVAPTGETFWFLSSKIPMRDADGKIVGIVGIGRNISAIKDSEARLNQAHKQLLEVSRQAGMAEVATNVLHNVGNVLNSVNVSSSLIADNLRNSKVSNLVKAVDMMQGRQDSLADFLVNDPKGKQLPGYLSSLGAHMAQEQEEILREVGSLVENIIHIKEIVAMQQSYATASGFVELLQVEDLVEDAMRMNNVSISRDNIMVMRDFVKVPPIMTEKHKVLQILVNLIRNAKHACDDSGRDDKQITLRVAHVAERISISVTDNGIGIPAENLTRIFNHGFTTRKNGHGFGLHSGANAAKELGGSLVVFSEGTGQGATFTLELPAK